MLLHRSTPIPGAADTLRYLRQNEIPFALLTNGGGKSEAERAAELSTLLGIDIQPSILIQSHTPFTAMLDRTSNKRVHFPAGLRRQTVLVTGANAAKAREIARGYGFESVVTPADILKACPEIFPFEHLAEFYDKQQVLPLPKPIYSPKSGPQELKDCLQIRAALVFNDPRDWAVDLQLLMDLAASHRGYLGTRAVDFAKRDGPKSDGPKSDGSEEDKLSIQVIYSNNDFVWSAGFHLPRAGQGAFQRAAHHLMLAAGSPGLVREYSFGKPHTIAYDRAERALVAQWKDTAGAAKGQPLKRVYMVGDNPASDIAGVWKLKTRINRLPEAGPRWRSCLVKTGVWKDADGVNVKQRPDAFKDDVKSAVEWAIKEEASGAIKEEAPAATATPAAAGARSQPRPRPNPARRLRR